MSGFLKFVLIGLAAMSGAMAMPILMSSEATPSPCRNAGFRFDFRSRVRIERPPS